MRRYLEEFSDTFPYRIHVSGLATKDVVSYAQQIRPELDNRLLDHGAVLFKGLPLKSSHDFSQFFRSLGYAPRNDIGGSAYRDVVAPNVLNSSSERAACCIEPHLETAYYSNHPYVVSTGFQGEEIIKSNAFS
jgi:hypothetical protein